MKNNPNLTLVETSILPMMQKYDTLLVRCEFQDNPLVDS